MKPGNSGGAKGPWFKANVRSHRQPGDWREPNTSVSVNKSTSVWRTDSLLGAAVTAVFEGFAGFLSAGLLEVLRMRGGPEPSR